MKLELIGNKLKIFGLLQHYI